MVARVLILALSFGLAMAFPVSSASFQGAGEFGKSPIGINPEPTVQVRLWIARGAAPSDPLIFAASLETLHRTGARMGTLVTAYTNTRECKPLAERLNMLPGVVRQEASGASRVEPEGSVYFLHIAPMIPSIGGKNPIVLSAGRGKLSEWIDGTLSALQPCWEQETSRKLG